jgi:hypothetical protein
MAGEKRVRWQFSAQEDVTDTLDRILNKAAVADGVFSKLGGALGKLMAGVSVAGLLAAVKGITDAGDAAFKAGQKAGVSAEQWQKLEYAAKLADVSGEQLGKGLKGLGDLAMQAADGGKGAQDTFKRLGVDWQDAAGKMKSSDQLLLDMADRFSKMPDGIEKTALATKVFGKAGMDLIPFLNQGREGIEELMVEAERLGIVIDNKTAAASEALNDNLTRMAAGARGLATQAIAPLIPFIGKMADEFTRSSKEGGAVSTWAAMATGALRVLGTVVLVVKGVFELLGNQIGGVAAAVVAFFSGDFRRSNEILAQMRADNLAIAKKTGADIAALWNGVETGSTKAAVAVTAAGKSGLKAAEDLEKFDAVLAKVLGKSTGLDASFSKDLQTLFAGFQSGAFGKGTAALEKYREAVEALIKQQPFYKAQVEELKREVDELAKSEAVLVDAFNAQRKAADDAIGALARGNKDLEFEISLIGKTTYERELAILAREKERALMQATTPEQRAVIDNLFKERAALLAVRDQLSVNLEAQRSYYSQVEGFVFGLVDALEDGVGGAFDYLKKQAKAFLVEMIKIFAKQYVLNVAMNGSGGGGGGVLGSVGNAILGSDGGGLAGTAVSFVGSAAATMALGTAGAGAMGATAGGAFAQGMMGMGTGVWASGSAGAMGASLSGVYSALAAIPVWGWIAMAVIAIGAWIAGNHKGGPKVGGSFFSGGGVPGTDNGRFFTPNQGDDVVRQMVDATSRGYVDAITRLGGNGGGFNFGLGFDHDPNGTARSRVSSLVTDASGREIYGVRDREMDDKEVEGALALEMQRMLVAALQASDLHDALDAVFDGIDVSTATAEELQAVLAQAMELKKVIDVLGMWGVEGLDIEALRAMQREGETLTDTLNGLANAQANYYQLFYTEEENLLRQTEMMRKQFQALGLEMPTTREGFRDLVESMLDGTEEGSRLYRVLLELAPAFADLVPAVEDVGDAVTEVVEEVGRAIDSVYSQNPHELARGFMQEFQSRFGELFGGQGSMSDRLSLTSAVAGDQIAANRARMAALEAQYQGYMLPPEWTALSNMNAQLEEVMRQAGVDLGRLTVLTAQYGEEIGEAIFELDKWYDAQKIMLAGNNAALLALEELYGRRRTEILERNAEEAETAIDRARAGIGDWLRGLFLDQSLSPLNPADRLAYAKDAYLENLGKAQAGDEGALSNYTKLAQDYLRELRAMYGSDSAYLQGLADVAAEGGALAGLEDARNVTAGDMKAAAEAIVQAIKDLQATVGRGDQLNAAHLKQFAEASKRTAEGLRRAVAEGELTFNGG